MDSSYLMKLELDDKEYFFSSCISEYWLEDSSSPPEEIKLSDYENCNSPENLSYLINYWLENKSDEEPNKELILKYLNTIPQFKSNLSLICNPELIYYEFNGVGLHNVIPNVDDFTKKNYGYKINLKEEGFLFIKDEDISQKITDDLEDIWIEETKEYLEETIQIFKDDIFIFLTKQDEQKLFDFIRLVVQNLSEIHFKN